MIAWRCVTCGLIAETKKDHCDFRIPIGTGFQQCPETRSWVAGSFIDKDHRETTCHNYNCTHDCRWKHGFYCDCQCHPSGCDRGKSCDYDGKLHQHGVGNAYFLMPPLPPYVKHLMSQAEQEVPKCHYVFGTGDWTELCGEEKAHLTHSPRYGNHRFVPPPTPQTPAEEAPKGR